MFRFPRRMMAVLALASLLHLDAHATENGQISYPVGVNTVLNGVLPPPGGTQFYNYTLYYVANKFAGSDGQSLVPGFHLNAFVDAPRVIHTWNINLGPFTLSSGTIVPIFHLHVGSPGGTGNRTALGDIILEPWLIGYSNPSHSFFAFFATDVAVPSGAYSVNRVANTGLNTYALMPYLSTTWFPTPAVEISTTALVEVNSPNSATHYHSGAVAALDYLVGYSLNSKVQVGLQGYLLKQFTDDTVNGMPVPGGGFRGQAVAIGPQIRYMWSPAAGIVFKYQHEFAVRNRPQGEKLWMELSFPL
ncbi:transporter [Caballeronia sp. SBC2]|uniref:SphA family protein n=1 Tax=Caballeronia sp. SBC2 TaxID=2705547 RepID=UPI0013E10D4B|nr:transporter [Caballeronia sp. SBC2]QIE29762.1 Putative MetA-pathway of phenol degradation [Caballeronia sp. SBC2]